MIKMNNELKTLYLRLSTHLNPAEMTFENLHNDIECNCTISIPRSCHKICN